MEWLKIFIIFEVGFLFGVITMCMFNASTDKTAENQVDYIDHN